MNKIKDILDVIIPVLISNGVTDFHHGFSINSDNTDILAETGLTETIPIGIDSFPKLLDTQFFNGIHIQPLSTERRFKEGIDLVTIKLGPNIKLNQKVNLYSISVLGNFFYKYNQTNVTAGVSVLPSFVDEATFKPFKRIIVNIDLDEAKDTLSKIIGDEFIDNLPGLEMQLTDITEKKNQMVKLQKYDEAAMLRDNEKHIISLIDVAKKRKLEPIQSKLERIKERTSGSFIETISREFSDALSKIIVEPNYTNVEEYTPIFLRLTPDSFTYINPELYSTSQELDYLITKSYLQNIFN